MEVKNSDLLSAYSFLKKAEGKKQTIFLVFAVLFITLIQCCVINREYRSDFICNYTIYGTAIINMFYSFVLASDGICIREKKSGRIEWFLANGVSSAKIIKLFTISEFAAAIITEIIYLTIILLLIAPGIINRSFLRTGTILIILIINIVFYSFVDLMNCMFLAVRKPESIKMVLLAGFTCMFFAVYIPIYFISIYNINNISMLGIGTAFALLLSILQILKKRICNSGFNEKVALSFKE